MSTLIPGIESEFAMIAEIYDVSSKLLGEALQMGKKPTKTGATRIRKLLNAAGRNVKLARKDFREYTMEKFGVKEDPEKVTQATQSGLCPECQEPLDADQMKAGRVYVCYHCGSKPFEPEEDLDAETGNAPQS